MKSPLSLVFEAAGDIGGQFDLARRIPGKEEFDETIRYFRRRLELDRVELRLATRRRLVAKKARALRTLHRLLRAPEPGLVVPFSDADTVLAALTAVRLFLAERLDQYEALPATGKRRPQILGQAYELLTWWQESLLSAMGHRVSTP